MATKTLIKREGKLSPEDKTLVNNYILQQMAEGTTDGISTTVSRTGVSGDASLTGDLVQRNWTTVEAATAFVAFCNNFEPTPTYAVVVS